MLSLVHVGSIKIYNSCDKCYPTKAKHNDWMDSLNETLIFVGFTWNKSSIEWNYYEDAGIESIFLEKILKFNEFL